MLELEVNSSSKTYSILISENALDELADIVAKQKASSVFLVSNAIVWQHYGKRVSSLVPDAKNYLLPEGEVAKSLNEIEKLYTFLIENNADRKSLIIAFGGGVVGDAAGFAAASFMRGIRFIQVPTTLLSQVDSSVGGKVGINHSLGKNMIGAFYQPEAVLIDTSTLNSLPERELRCGLGEVIKYGYIYDAIFLDKLKKSISALLNLDAGTTKNVIKRCLEIKRDVVNEDERENGIRAILNFGHSFAHAIEAFHKYKGIKHGEAVLAGMLPALYLSAKENSEINFEEEAEFIRSIFSYKISDKADISRFINFMRSDKKNTGDSINIIRLNKLGEAKLRQGSEAKLREAFEVLL